VFVQCAVGDRRHPQIRAGKHLEAGIITSGDDLTELKRFVPADGSAYHATDVVAVLLGGMLNSGDRWRYYRVSHMSRIILRLIRLNCWKRR